VISQDAQIATLTGITFGGARKKSGPTQKNLSKVIRHDLAPRYLYKDMDRCKKPLQSRTHIIDPI